MAILPDNLENFLEETIQEQEKRYFVFMMVMGRWIPGLDILWPWPKLKPLFRIYTYIPLILFIHMTIQLHLMIMDPDVPLLKFWTIWRRATAFLVGSLRMIHHRRNAKLLDRIFDTWNNEINTSFYQEKRLALLKTGLKKMRKVIYISALGAIIYPQFFCISLFFGRHMADSNIAGWPHDVNVSYHYALTVLNYFIYGLGVPNAFFCDVLTLYAFAMLSAQLRCLRESLADIVGKVDVIEGKVVLAETGTDVTETDLNRIRSQLKIWLTANWKTLRWAKDIQEFEKVECGLKYFFILSYLLLFVFSMPEQIGRSTGLHSHALSVLYAGCNMLVLFHGTRLCDNIAEDSHGVFDDAYEKAWFIYPKDMRNTFAVISTASKGKPIEMRTMKMWADNSNNFLQVLNITYRTLTFLLQSVSFDN